MGKHSAQARNEENAGGVRDQSRMAATRHEARGTAQEPDGVNAGTQRWLTPINCCVYNTLVCETLDPNRCNRVNPRNHLLCPFTPYTHA